jgi:peptidoglycan hydrolase-like protein with peptidoglycan-binding domain
MEFKKLALAAALMAAGTAFAGDNKPADKQTSASANQPAASASANQSSSMAASSEPKAKGDESVKQLQQALKDKGFDPGPIDGIKGPRTEAAIQQAQAAGVTVPGMSASASSRASTNQPAPSASANQPAASASANQAQSSSTNQPASSASSAQTKQ